MIILDENVTDDQRQELVRWRMRIRQIGVEVGRPGTKDEAIIPLLHALRRPTFFSRDRDFYHRHLQHAGYCLVMLAVARADVATYIRRFLRHPEFATQAKRMGTVVRVSPGGIHVWRWRSETEQEVAWHD